MTWAQQQGLKHFHKHQTSRNMDSKTDDEVVLIALGHCPRSGASDYISQPEAYLLKDLSDVFEQGQLFGVLEAGSDFNVDTGDKKSAEYQAYKQVMDHLKTIEPVDVVGKRVVAYWIFKTV